MMIPRCSKCGRVKVSFLLGNGALYCAPCDGAANDGHVAGYDGRDD